MRHWKVIDAAVTPEAGTLTLLQGGDAFVIRADGEDLMTSRLHGSEEVLAEVARPTRPDARVLVGGLGMGFTLRAALDGVGPEAHVTVAELLQAVVLWNHGPLGPLASHPLDDPRVHVHVGDVRALLRPGAGPWDAVLLDVDNGPAAFTQVGNDALYSLAGLKAARAAMRAGGRFAVWSAFEDDGFARRLGQAGFAVQTHATRARRGGGSRHWVYVGQAP